MDPKNIPIKHREPQFRYGSWKTRVITNHYKLPRVNGFHMGIFLIPTISGVKKALFDSLELMKLKAKTIITIKGVHVGYKFNGLLGKDHEILVEIYNQHFRGNYYFNGRLDFQGLIDVAMTDPWKMVYLPT